MTEFESISKSTCNIIARLQIIAIRIDISHHFVYFPKKQGIIKIIT